MITRRDFLHAYQRSLVPTCTIIEEKHRERVRDSRKWCFYWDKGTARRIRTKCPVTDDNEQKGNDSTWKCKLKTKYRIFPYESSAFVQYICLASLDFFLHN